MNYFDVLKVTATSGDNWLRTGSLLDIDIILPGCLFSSLTNIWTYYIVAELVDLSTAEVPPGVLVRVIILNIFVSLVTRS